MRAYNISDGFKVQAVAGTYVVLLAWDLPETKCEGLLGFAIHRVDHFENECYYLDGMKTFTETDPGFVPGSLYSTRDHPIQSFQWADYSVKPNHKYTFTVYALKGVPFNLEPFASTDVTITTESPASGNHDVYFNRGTAASQEYERRFGDRRPNEVQNKKAYEWLSRGLYEALTSYISSCEAGKHALYIAAYEFNYAPLLQLIKATSDRGVHIRIVYDARKDQPAIINRQIISESGLDDITIARSEGKSYISHNKFIVKLENDEPVSVWTGGMNFSEGGIFGHSNVAHVVEDPQVARKYFDYWEALASNPRSAGLKALTASLTPLPGLPAPRGTTAVFSPRKNLDALQWYADLAVQAKDGLFITFAFGMHELFQDVYRNGKAGLRFALLEKITRPLAEGPERTAEEKKIQLLRFLPENVFAIGDFIKTNQLDGWVKEKLSDLNSNVRFIHNKFMLVDPLSDDPVIVAGSANFSEASTLLNDENMLVIRGDTRVADIYLGEFMRLFSHHTFRESLKWRKADEPPKPLSTGDWWKDSFGDTPRAARRRYFAQVGK